MRGRLVGVPSELFIWKITTPVTLAVIFIVRKYASGWPGKVFSLSAIPLILWMLVWNSPWSFRDTGLSAVVVSLGYTSLMAFIVACGVRFASRWQRVLAQLVVVLLLSGQIFAGWLAMPRIVREIKILDSPPANSDYAWRLKLLPGDKDMIPPSADLELLWHPRLFPFLEKRLTTTRYDASHYQLNFVDVTFQPGDRTVLIGRKRLDGSLEAQTLALP